MARESDKNREEGSLDEGPYNSTKSRPQSPSPELLAFVDALAEFAADLYLAGDDKQGDLEERPPAGLPFRLP